jgi:capsular exopolysaccharide synthesis family protein
LSEVQFQRQTAENVLEQLRAEMARAAGLARAKAASPEVIREFYAMPEVAALAKEIQQIGPRLKRAQDVSRRPDEAAIVAMRMHSKSLESELSRLWQLHRPALEQRLAGGDGGRAIREAEAEVVALKAREAVLRERLERLQADQRLELESRRDRLVKRHGPRHEAVREVEEQMARLDAEAAQASTDPRQAQADAIIKSIEQGLKSVEALRAEVEQRFRDDLAQSNKAEIGRLAESNLRDSLERQRALFHSVVDQLRQAQLVSDFVSVTAQILDPPVAVEKRQSARFVMLVALIAGCGLGAGAVYFADQVDARLRSLAEIRRLLNYRLLGVVPLLSRAQKADAAIGLISHMRPRSRVAETYKSIRTGVDLLRRNWEAKVIMLASPQPADGKSSIASNLAICLAQSGRRVLLVDADLRRPSLHEIYGHPRSPGLTEVLADEVPFPGAARSTEVANLDLLTAGAEVAHPAELLASGRLGALADDLRRAYDLVIVDTSPLLAVTDPSIIALAVDGIVLVVRAAATRRLEAEQSLDLLTTLETPVLGLIVNGISVRSGRYGYPDADGAYGTALPPARGEGGAGTLPPGGTVGRRERRAVGFDGDAARPYLDP